MKDFTHVNIGRRRFLRLGVFASIASSIKGALYSSEEVPKRTYFNVPEGSAAKTLKLAVKQAKVEIILSADMVKDVRTRKIRGIFTPIEAFNRMLSGSKLEMVRHEESGVYTIKKIGDSKINADLSSDADTKVNNPPK